MKKYLCYEDFGAIGDGKTDDFKAIIACHEEANRTGTPVKTKDGKTYYIGGADMCATIKTDVDFGTSRFIIDDRNVERNTSYVFSIESDFERFNIDIPSLEKSATKIDNPYKENLFVYVKNYNEKIFIRKGLNQNNGTSTMDIFTVDALGNIYPAVNFNYPTVSEAWAISTDDKPITVKGGIFTTIANYQESYYRYLQRGFNISRSHVTICNFEHYVEGELDHGAPYHGFIRTNYAYDVTIRDAIITPRFIYLTESAIPGKTVSMGSYDLSFWSSIDVRCINVKQTIDISDKRYWGIYTSNFCKNLYLENCIFSRFDAHMGVTGATIKNCTLGHQGIQLIGAGNFLIENSTIKRNAPELIYLRCDYGSTFEGDITIRNCTWETSSQYLRIINENNVGDHDYGYTCYYGKHITIDGLNIISTNSEPKENMSISVLSDGNGISTEKPYPYKMPEELTISNIKNNKDIDIIISRHNERFEGLKINKK